MEGFLSKLKTKAEDAGKKLSDIFTLTEEEKSKGKEADTLEKIGGGARKARSFLFGPTREEMLQDIQSERKQTLMPEVAKSEIVKRERELGLTDYTIPEIEMDEEGNLRQKEAVRSDQSLTDFLKNRPVQIDPTGAMGSIKRTASVSLKNLGNIVKEKSAGAIRKILQDSGVERRVVDTISDDLAKAGTRAKVSSILKKGGVGTETAKKKATKTVTEDVSRATEKTKKTEPERKFVQRAEQMEPNMGQFLEGKYKARSTDELIARADQLIKEAPDKAEELARTGTTDEAVATASRLVTAYVKEAKKTTDKAAQNSLWEKAASIANSAAKNLTDHGRAVQAATILGRMTPEGMVRYAAREIQRHNEMVEQAASPVKKTIGNLFGDIRTGKALKKVPELTGEQASRIQKEMERVANITDDTKRAMEFQKLDEEIKAMIPSSLYQKIITVWKAGLLTGLKTTGLNIASNVSHAVSEIVKDVPAGLVDKIASLFTGKRTLGVTAKGTSTGVKEGIAKGWRYFRTGFDERDVGTKLDYKKVNFGTSPFAKKIQQYEETVFRTIGSQDQPFYYAAKARSLFSQAIAQAKNAGLKGAKAKKFIEDLVASPTDDMLKYATLDAETSVFQNRTSLGAAARSIQNLPGGQIVLPFGKTPSAVATQIINYSPVGIVKTIAENIGKGKFDQRLFSQAMGRGMTGTGVLYLGGELYDKGMVALDYPSSEKERKQWELEGKRSNSVNVDGRWRNVATLGPLGLLLIIGGQMKRGIDNTGSFVGGLAGAAGGFGATLTEQSFLKGINDTISAIQDPERSFQGWASSLSGSIVPTIISDIARSTDKYERLARTPGTRLKSRIPGLRQTLEPKVDVLGNRLETPGFFETMLDATRPGVASADQDDPVVKELSRLAETGNLATPTQLGPNAGYKSLTPEQNTYLWRLAGTASRQGIENVMNMPMWKNLDDEQKADAIGKAVSDAKIEARARAVVNAVEGLDAEEVRKKLAEMKDDKLLTQSVFGRYLSLTR